MKTPEMTLSNGMQLFYLNQQEVQFLYAKIPSYFRHGIAVREGDTVFDVGANIGLFSLFVSQKCNNNVDIYAFEPVPKVFEVLQRNVQRFNPEKVKLFPCGLAESAGTASLTYYPNSTGWSTAYPKDSQESKAAFKQFLLSKLDELPIPSVRRLRWFPPVLRSRLVDRMISRVFQSEQVTCQFQKLSDIICQYQIERIDLLKVNLEGSELDVLLGIEDRHWSKIEQAVLEVHDYEGRVEKVTALLRTKGLSEIVVEQVSFLAGSPNYHVYASRQK